MKPQAVLKEVLCLKEGGISFSTTQAAVFKLNYSFIQLTCDIYAVKGTGL